ncbi:MAG: hypothetical protein MSG64_01740 [Pyrinomonadaceae bacterium MAG19_C2-C3]|nr:hypothetical protein [Pyrinomonadaceae bacterium MAG19_C2-C3]
MSKMIYNEMDDDLRDEYDLTKLTVVMRGHERERRRLERRAAKLVVEIDDDLRARFPDAVAVNSALRTLIEETKST